MRRESSRKKRISPIDQEIIERVADECEPQGLENNLERLYYFIYQLDELNRALMLLYLDAPPYKEVGEILGISESNVATKISRIKQQIKQAFKAEPDQ